MKGEKIICIAIIIHSLCWVNLDKLFTCIWIVKYIFNEGEMMEHFLLGIIMDILKTATTKHVSSSHQKIYRSLSNQVNVWLSQTRMNSENVLNQKGVK